MDERDDRELYWAAGFFDGEGHARIDKGIEVSISQIDRQVLDRFQQAVRAGKVYGPYQPRNPNAQPIYDWKVTDQEGSTKVIELLLKLVSPVKRNQLETVIKKSIEMPRKIGKLATHCRNGHLWTDENTYQHRRYNKRMCRECQRNRKKAYLADVIRRRGDKSKLP